MGWEDKKCVVIGQNKNGLINIRDKRWCEKLNYRWNSGLNNWLNWMMERSRLHSEADLKYFFLPKKDEGNKVWPD